MITGISKCSRPNRPSPFGIRWEVDGRKRYRYFETKAVRDAEYRELREKVHDQGRAILRLSSAQATLFEYCLQLVGSEAALIEACRDYADKHSVVAIEPRTAVQEFLDEKRAMGRDENYCRTSRNILDRLISWIPESLSEWSAALARDWTLSLAQSFAPVTVNNHVRVAKVFCYWCVSHQHLRENPFANTPTPQVVSSEPELLKVDQIQALLETAQTQFPEAVPYLALNAFAGLRSSACARPSLDQIPAPIRSRSAGSGHDLPLIPCRTPPQC